MDFSDLGIKVKNTSSGVHATTCPKCSPTRKNKSSTCLSHNNEEGNRWWRCNHCEWSGNLEVHEKMQEVYKEANYKKVEVFSPTIRQFFTDRGINPQTAIDNGVYQVTKHNNLVIGFPFYKGYTLCNVKFRNPTYKKGDDGVKHWQIGRSKGSEAVLMGLNKVEFSNEEYRKTLNKIVITEGETDYLSFKQAGINNVVSVPEGSKQDPADYMSDDWSKNILKYIDVFIIAVDNDSAGKELQEKLCKFIGRNRCMLVDYGTHNDANDVLRSVMGEEGLARLVAEAKPYPISGIVKAADIRTEILDIRDNGWDRGKLRNNDMDNLYTYKAPYLYIFTGVPKSGKTEWVLSDVNDMLNNNPGEKFAVYSPEMRPAKRFYSKMIQKVKGKKLTKLSDNEINEAIEEIDKKYFLISPNRKNFETFGNTIASKDYGTLDFLLAHIKHLAVTEGIFGYIIDPWNKIEGDMDKGVSETNFIGKQLDKLIDFNEQYDLCGIVIVHPHKMTELPSGNFAVPGMYNINGGANWFNKADVGVTIHRNPWEKSGDTDPEGAAIYNYNKLAPTQIITKAIKFEELGRMGREERYYSEETDQFTTDAFTSFTPVQQEMNIEPSIVFEDEGDVPF